MQNAKPPHPNPLPRGERRKRTLIQHDPGARAPALRAGTQTSFKTKAFAELATAPDAAALFNTRPVDWVPAFRRDDDCEDARTALNAARNLTPLSP